MAAICYDSDTGREVSIRRAIACKDKGHLATMRFAYATFNVSGISRICSHQIVRMAHAGILQRSQRYVKESVVKFVRPPSLEMMPTYVRQKWDTLEALSRELYQNAIDEGMKKEDARYALLHSAETELNLCLNFQAWRDFLRNRLSKSAQWEVRDMANEIRQHLVTIAPGIFQS
jgi:thymidylate synthase (FAD)